MERREEKIRLVADTNIMISALLRDDSFHAKLIKSGHFDIYYPDYGLKEIDGYRTYIISKRKKKAQWLAFDYALRFILESVNMVPSELYSQKMREAYDLMKKIDEKDTPFLALAMQLGCPIWSNDSHFKKLVGFEVYTTKDILKLLNIGPEVPE